MSDRPHQADIAPAPLIIEWYRIDSSVRVVRVLVPCVLLMALGACLGVVAATGRIDVGQVLRTWHWRVPMTVSGLGLIAYSVFRAIYGLQKLLAADAYLTLRTDALVFHDDQTHVETPWDDVDDTFWDAPRKTLTLRTRSGQETHITRPFAGIDGPALAKRIEHVRKRALFGIRQ